MPWCVTLCPQIPDTAFPSLCLPLVSHPGTLFTPTCAANSLTGTQVLSLPCAHHLSQLCCMSAIYGNVSASPSPFHPLRLTSPTHRSAVHRFHQHQISVPFLLSPFGMSCMHLFHFADAALSAENFPSLPLCPPNATPTASRV